MKRFHTRLKAQPDGHEVELVGAVGEALLEGVHPVGLPLGQRQGHLRTD